MSSICEGTLIHATYGNVGVVVHRTPNITRVFWIKSGKLFDYTKPDISWRLEHSEWTIMYSPSASSQVDTAG